MSAHNDPSSSNYQAMPPPKHKTAPAEPKNEPEKKPEKKTEKKTEKDKNDKKEKKEKKTDDPKK